MMHEEISYQFREAGPALFALTADYQPALADGRIDVLRGQFKAHGHLLSAEATLTTIASRQEWFVAQIGRTFSILARDERLEVVYGRIVQQVVRHADLPHGPTHRYRDGDLIEVINFRAGKIDGLSIAYEKGKKQASMTYREGKLHGPMVVYDAAEQPTIEMIYVDGLLDGSLTLYANSTKHAVVHYQNGVLNGTSTTFYDGEQKSVTSHYREGLLDGDYMLYAEDGQLLQRVRYQNGRRIGVMIEYYPNGKTRLITPYQDGKREGLLRSFDSNGRLSETRRYQAGKQVGKPKKVKRWGLF